MSQENYVYSALVVRDPAGFGEAKSLVASFRAEGLSVVRSCDLTRRQRELMLRHGFLNVLTKGWYYLQNVQGMQSAPLLSFVARYCTERFDEAWHLSPELSLLLHAGIRKLPSKLVVYTPLGKNGQLHLAGFGTLIDYKVKEKLPDNALTAMEGLRVIRLPYALLKCSEAFLRQHRDEIVRLLPLLDPDDPFLVAAGRERGLRSAGKRLVALLREAGRLDDAERLQAHFALAKDYLQHGDAVPQTDQVDTLYGERLQDMLQELARGGCSVADAYQRLQGLPFEDVGHTLLDHHRLIRQGQPEVIYGEGKSGPQIVSIMERLNKQGVPQLVTRVESQKAKLVMAACPGVTYDRLARCLQRGTLAAPGRKRGDIVVLTAGTSDAAVAQEALVTARFLGNNAHLITDVGVAGLHRLLHHVATLQKAAVLIVVAGMEGALPSVVAGLVDVPVIAVPTSVGYGTAFEGMTALLAMMTSCASGVTVVNIDNGFGAAMAADLMNRDKGTTV